LGKLVDFGRPRRSRLTCSRLAAENAGDHQAVSDAQKKALRFMLKGLLAVSGATPAVRRSSLKRPSIVQIMPMSGRSMSQIRILGREEPAVFIVITDPEQSATPAEEILTKAFGLTPTEAALALQIRKGLSVEEAADALSISEQTTRWHLKNVHSKTDTSHQIQLVALLLKMTAPLR
jgi:DNA-binding CsgD family transcriptional regulator